MATIDDVNNNVLLCISNLQLIAQRLAAVETKIDKILFNTWPPNVPWPNP